MQEGGEVLGATDVARHGLLEDIIGQDWRGQSGQS